MSMVAQMLWRGFSRLRIINLPSLLLVPPRYAPHSSLLNPFLPDTCFSPSATLALHSACHHSHSTHVSSPIHLLILYFSPLTFYRFSNHGQGSTLQRGVHAHPLAGELCKGVCRHTPLQGLCAKGCPCAPLCFRCFTSDRFIDPCKPFFSVEPSNKTLRQIQQ